MGTWLRLLFPYVIEAAKDCIVPPENDTPAKAGGRISFIVIGLLVTLCFFFGEKVFELSTEKHQLQLNVKTLTDEKKELELINADLRLKLDKKPNQNPAPYDSNISSKKNALRRETVDDHDMMIEHITFN